MLDDAWMRSLRERFGHSDFRPVQKEVVSRIASGGSALLVLPTGAGKSLTFQLPAVHRGSGSALPADGMTLVFSPLIALMEDQVSALTRREIAATFINSTLDRDEREARYSRVEAGEFDLVYVTPERMDKPEFLRALARVPGGIRLLVVDEAHCIAEWGHDFRPAYQRIGEFRKQLGDPVTIAATATATRRVREEIREVLGLDREAMPLFSTGVDRPNLHYRTFEVWGESDKIDTVAQIATVGPGTGIVYFTLIHSIESIATDLTRALGRRPVEIYHGQLDPREKRRVQRRFEEATPDEGLVLLATNAFGMGVDKPDIRWVVHGEVPGSVESYAQETGRAGRDGQPSLCALLFDDADVLIQHQFIEGQNPGVEWLERAANELALAPHGGLELEDLRAALFGRKKDRRAEACVLELERRGVCETVERDGFVRSIRRLEPGEIDPATLDSKLTRDRERLLAMVELSRSDDMRADINAYFDL